MPGVAQAHANRAAEALGRQTTRIAQRRTPPNERQNYRNVRDGVDPEGRGDSEPGDDRAAERWTNGAAHIDADAVGCNARLQVPLRNEQRHNRLPRRGGHRARRADWERKGEQNGRRHQASPYENRKAGRDQGVGRLADNQEPALVENISQSTSRDREQKDRQAAGDLNQGDG